MRWLHLAFAGYLLAAAIAFPASPAELPELLQPVSPAIEAKLMANEL